MIVVEERLTEVFAQLPEIDGFKPVYDWGNKEHLLKVLHLYADEKQSPYPLIYQVSDESEQDSITNEGEVNLALVVATLVTDQSLLNKNRWAMSYQNVLIPVVKNIETAFTKGGIFRWDGQYKLKNYPNYGSGEANSTTEIWDAIRITTKIVVTDGCVNKIRF